MNKSNKLSISCARQYLFVEAVLKKPTSTGKLIRITGQNNVPDIPYRLRKKGWNIIGEKITVKDRNGKTVYPYEYSIAQSQRQQALEALAAYDKNQEAK